MEYDEITQVVASVEGWLTTQEGSLLYQLANTRIEHGVIIEIGSWKGKSTIWLAHGSINGPQLPVIAIDPHIGSPEHQSSDGEKVWTFDEFQKNIKHAQASSIVSPLVLPSEDAAKQVSDPIVLIFIDGAHEYDMVLLDYKVWFPKIANHGIMAFHDTSIPGSGPNRVVKEKLYRSHNFRNVRVVGSITYAEKIFKASMKDRISSYGRLIKRILREHLGKIVRPLVHK